jgi:hypothetical protein
MEGCVASQIGEQNRGLSSLAIPQDPRRGVCTALKRCFDIQEAGRKAADGELEGATTSATEPVGSQILEAAVRTVGAQRLSTGRAELGLFPSWGTASATCHRGACSPVIRG